MQIFVIGSHRSGTSSVTRILNLMGVYLGPEGSLIPALPENPKGFWERRDVLELDKKILNSLGSNWYRVHDFDLKQLPEDSRLEYQKEIQKIISALDAFRPWAIKEPRLSLLFPLWKNFLEVPVCIHVARHPLEVAKSLKTRNDFPITVGLALWEYYLINEIKNLWQLPRVSVFYEELMHDPIVTTKNIFDELTKFGVKGLNLPSQHEITSFIDPTLYREKTNAQSVDEFCPSPILKLWQEIKSGDIWTKENPPSLSAYSEEIVKLFGERRLFEDFFQIHKKQNEEFKQEVVELRKKAIELEKEKTIRTLTVRLNRQSELQQRLNKLIATRMQLSLWFENISGGLHHTLASKHWIVGTRLIKIEANLKAELDACAKLVLHYQTWEGKENYSHLANEADENEIQNYESLSNEVLKRFILQSENKISELQILENQFKHQILEIQTWLREIIACYEKIISSRSWKLGARIVEKSKKLVNRKSPSIPWPHEIAFYARIFRHWDHSNNPNNVSQNISLVSKNIEPKVFYDLTAKTAALVSIIVLNKDGAHHLESFFRSFLEHNSFTELEFIVVDHASRDTSLRVIEKYTELLPIRLIAYDKNNSYSFSNNEAAKISNSKYLFFVNNDIIFTNDILSELISEYEDHSDVGLVGSRLYFPKDKNNFEEGRLQHAGIAFEEDQSFQFFRPVNIDGKHRGELSKTEAELFPAVTAAAVLCKRDEFLKLGGFSKDYFYGYEDVDLALRFLKNNRFSLVPNHLSLIHNESATRNLAVSEEKRERSLKNIAALQKNFGYALKRAVLNDKFVGSEFWTLEKPVVAFAVTEAAVGATAGDYFTAYELAEHCRKAFGWQTKFLALRDKQKSWYDLSGVDLLITMVDRYDLRQVQNAKHNLITVAWLRNWFDRWAEQPWFKDYNLCLCSSEKSANFIRKNYDKSAIVFRIATNTKRFSEGTATEAYLADCAFTGSYWKAKRDIEDAFSPTENGPSFAIYGHGWEDHPKLSKYHRGFLPYQKLPDVYRSSKIVLDDANHVTKSWGSVNSRVFDAIASGCLVISNGEEGVAEIFADLLPIYTSAKDLEEKIDYYLSQDTKRKELVDRLKKQVLKKHTYAHRAIELRSHILDFTNNKYRIAIKAPVPRIEEAQSWGDYHFAVALKQEFEKLGHSVRIDILPDWNTPKQMADQVAIVLRGLSAYTPNPEQINLIWNISHPDKVSREEYNKYDHVFVASSIYAKQLQKELSVPVSTLFQCTNKKYFHPTWDSSIPTHDLLFVGNSRKEYRQIVKDSIQSKLPISVYGTRWEGIIDQHYILGQNIPNNELPKYYSNAKIVLNDHWPSMSKHGFISNRIFDAAACGACIISDQIQGAEELFGDALCTYKGAKDLKEKVEYFLKDENARVLVGEKLKSLVQDLHTFKNRVGEMLKVIDHLDRARRFPEIFEINNQENQEIAKSHPEASQKSVANL